MKSFILALLITLLSVPGAFAGATCYSPAETEAEQGIRIHSELMVIGLNCQHMGARYGMNLYGDYRSFTAKYGDLFASYEKVLIAFFQKRGDKNAVASMNAMRTQFANKISNDAAAMRPDVFCAQFAPRITKASKMSLEEVRKWAATVYPGHPVSYPACKA